MNIATNSHGPVVLDGSVGEGGGQILRSALSLSLVTGRPLELTHIRARRKRPGLMRQHLTAVKAAAEVGNAQVEGAAAGSRELRFAPGPVRAGRYSYAIGIAGSTTLVAQTVIPALLQADGPSQVIIEGGTHNPMAPPFDFLQRSYAPVLARMGARLDIELQRPGFYPAGGGRIRFDITPGTLQPVEILDRGAVLAVHARCMVADLPRSIAEREAHVIQRKLAILSSAIAIEELDNGPGNAVTVDVVTEAGIEVHTAFGEPRVAAEDVARRAARQAKAFLRSERAAVGEHLADQLLLPMALAGGGAFRTLRPSSHTETNARVVEAFLPVRIEMTEDDGSWVVRVRSTTN